MITGGIAIFLLIVILPPAINNGETGTMWLTIVIAVLLLFFGMVSRADDRARVNRMNYWAMSGKERAKARHRWEAEARREEEEERVRRQVIEERRREGTYRELPAVKYAEPSTRIYVCAKCGRTSPDGWTRELWDGRTVREDTCYFCRKKMGL